MKTLAYNLRFLKMIFFGGPWLKISAVYCFVGFIIEAWGQQGYMENVMEKSLSSYTLVISALPAVILLYYPILRTCQNSAAVVSEGKEDYIGRVRNLLWSISGAYVLYYGIGTYLLSKFVLSEGVWYNSAEGLQLWGLKLLLLLLFLMVVSLVYGFCMVRNVNPTAVAFVVLAGTFFFWNRIDVNGYARGDFSILCGILVVLLLAETYLLKRGDFMYWR